MKILIFSSVFKDLVMDLTRLSWRLEDLQRKFIFCFYSFVRTLLIYETNYTNLRMFMIY